MRLLATGIRRKTAVRQTAIETGRKNAAALFPSTVEGRNNQTGPQALGTIEFYRKEGGSLDTSTQALRALASALAQVRRTARIASASASGLALSPPGTVPQ